MGFKKAANHEFLVPNTILKDDIRKISLSTHRVLSILKKKKNDKLYSEIVYEAKNIQLSHLSIPNELKEKCSPNVFD